MRMQLRRELLKPRLTRRCAQPTALPDCVPLHLVALSAGPFSGLDVEQELIKARYHAPELLGDDSGKF